MPKPAITLNGALSLKKNGERRARRGVESVGRWLPEVHLIERLARSQEAVPVDVCGPHATAHARTIPRRLQGVRSASRNRTRPECRPAATLLLARAPASSPSPDPSVLPFAVEIQERYGRLGSADDFDRRYWQSQGPEQIFEALRGMIRDYLLLKEGHADEPRLQTRVSPFFQGLAELETRGQSIGNSTRM